MTEFKMFIYAVMLICGIIITLAVMHIAWGVV